MKKIVMQVKNQSGNIAKNQFVIIEGTNYTFQSYRTIVACLHAGSAFIDLFHPFDHSPTTTKHFLNYLENVLLKYRPTRKEVEKWIEDGYIPSIVNCYNTDIIIRSNW